jgi:hypothetical protein
VKLHLRETLKKMKIAKREESVSPASNEEILAIEMTSARLASRLKEPGETEEKMFMANRPV